MLNTHWSGQAREGVEEGILGEGEVRRILGALALSLGGCPQALCALRRTRRN